MPSVEETEASLAHFLQTRHANLQTTCWEGGALCTLDTKLNLQSMLLCCTPFLHAAVLHTIRAAHCKFEVTRYINWMSSCMYWDAHTGAWCVQVWNRAMQSLEHATVLHASEATHWKFDVFTFILSGWVRLYAGIHKQRRLMRPSIHGCDVHSLQ